MSFNRDDVQALDEQIAYQGFFQIKTVSLKHRLFAGGWSEAISRECFERGDAVGVLLYDPHRDQVVLVEQFRIGPYLRDDQPWITELVAGIVELGESAEDVARREAKEEADCVLQALLPIGEYFTSPGASSERVSLFCGKVEAEGLGGIHGLDAEAEDIRVKVLSYQDAFEQLENGEFNNAHTIIALQWLALNKERLLAQWC